MDPEEAKKAAEAAMEAAKAKAELAARAAMQGALTKSALVGVLVLGTVAGGVMGAATGGMTAWLATDKDKESTGAPPPAPVLAPAPPSIAPSTPGVVRVLSQPGGASVSIDGTARGATPIDLSATGGLHHVELALEGYATHAIEVAFVPGETSTLSVALASAPVEAPDRASWRSRRAQEDAAQRARDDERRREHCRRCRGEHRQCLDRGGSDCAWVFESCVRQWLNSVDECE